MLLYAITNRAVLAPCKAERAQRLAALASAWSAGGVDFVQVRENDLGAADLTRLAAEIVRAVRQYGNATKVLINIGTGTLGSEAVDLESGIGTAVDAGVDGIHLKGGLSARQLAATIRQIREAW